MFTIIKKLKQLEGKQTREFNYIDNIIDGILLLVNEKIKHSLRSHQYWKQ